MSDRSKKIKYDPDAIFKNRRVSHFGKFENFKDQYEDFTDADGVRKWINSIVVVFFFLAVEAIIIANYSPARDFVSSFFSLNR